MFKKSNFKSVTSFILLGFLAVFVASSCSKDKEEPYYTVQSIDDAIGAFSGTITGKVFAKEGEVIITKVDANRLKLSIKQGEPYSLKDVFIIPVKINKEDNTIISTVENIKFSYYVGIKNLLFLANKSQNPGATATVQFNGNKIK